MYQELISKINRFSYLSNLLLKQAAGSEQNIQKDISYLKSLDPSKEEAKEFLQKRKLIMAPIDQGLTKVTKEVESAIRKKRAIEAMGRFHSPGVPLGTQLAGLTFICSQLVAGPYQEPKAIAKRYVDYINKLQEGEKAARDWMARVKLARSKATELYQDTQRELAKAKQEDKPVTSNFRTNVIEMVKSCMVAVRYNNLLHALGAGINDLHLEDMNIKGDFRSYIEREAVSIAEGAKISDEQLYQAYLYFSEE